MSDETIGFSQSRHPAPFRERVGLTALFYGLFVAPIVWAGNLLTTYALATHACYPGSDPLERVIDGFGFAWPLILALYLASLVLCASGFVVSFRNWSLSGSAAERDSEHLVRVREGRTRYLSLIGMSYSVMFFIALVFGAVSLAIVPLCEL